MELGEVFKEDGQISYEKLFYFHHRVIPNQKTFLDVNGAMMTDSIVDDFKRYIKEENEKWCLCFETKEEVLDEKTVILFTHEILTGNGYCLTYYYGANRVLDDTYLESLAKKYSNSDNLNSNL